MIRTYPHKHSMNIGKQKKILAVAKAYRGLAVRLSALQWQEFYRHGGFNKNLDIKVVKSVLSERYKQTCQYQVVGALKSFVANRQNDFVKTVWRSSLCLETQKQLFHINKCGLWFAEEVRMPKDDEAEKEKKRIGRAMKNAQSDVAASEERLKAIEEGLKDGSQAEDPLVAEMAVKLQDALERARMRLFDLQKQQRQKEDGHAGVPQETLRLARAIFKHILGRHGKPSLRRCNLALDNKVARISPRQETEGKTAKKFAYWIAFSTLQPRRRIYLPLHANEYFEGKAGKINNFCQINISRDEQLTVCLIKDAEKAPYVPGTPKIALDFGLRNLFATNGGDLYGRDFIEVLKKYDTLITSLASNRQRQKLEVESPAYTALVSNLRNYLKNEINRVVNRIVEIYQPKEIAVEKLNFTSPRLSRRFNRILSNMGRKIIRKKFDSITEEFAIVIQEVPAPYTSQQCSICGYVDELNRKSQSTFVCRHCHTKLHADVNGANNIFARSSSKDLCNVHLSKNAILDILVRQFLQRYPDIYVHASELLLNNPHFRRARQYGNSGNSKFG